MPVTNAIGDDQLPYPWELSWREGREGRGGGEGGEGGKLDVKGVGRGERSVEQTRKGGEGAKVVSCSRVGL